MSEGRQASNAIYRSIMRQAAEAYIDPSFDADKPPYILDLAHTYGVDLGEDQVAHDKVKRYALATAAIHMMMQGAVVGGGAQARFAYINDVPMSDSPLLDVQTAAQESFIYGSRRVELKNETLSYALDQYEDLSESDPYAAITEGDDMREGGNLPGDGTAFVGASINALKACPDTRVMQTDEQIAISHLQVPAATGRAAKHLDIFSNVLPSWYDEIKNGILITRRGRYFQLIQQGGRPLFSVPQHILADIPLTGPLLKCPAHQHLLGRSFTALEQGLHAVINLAAHRGVYEYVEAR